MSGAERIAVEGFIHGKQGEVWCRDDGEVDVEQNRCAQYAVAVVCGRCRYNERGMSSRRKYFMSQWPGQGTAKPAG